MLDRGERHALGRRRGHPVLAVVLVCEQDAGGPDLPEQPADAFAVHDPAAKRPLGPARDVGGQRGPEVDAADDRRHTDLRDPRGDRGGLGPVRCRRDVGAQHLDDVAGERPGRVLRLEAGERLGIVEDGQPSSTSTGRRRVLRSRSAIGPR